jgi:hypothetical protein
MTKPFTSGFIGHFDLLKLFLNFFKKFAKVLVGHRKALLSVGKETISSSPFYNDLK